MTNGYREPDPGPGNAEQLRRIRFQSMLESIQKFRLFFAGLVFAMLAFSVQFSLKSPTDLVMFMQVAAWICLLLTGIFALMDAGGFVAEYTEKISKGLGEKTRISMWGLFIGALLLLGTARVLHAL